MFNRAKTESRGGVKWASRIAGEVGGGYSHRQGEVLTCGLLPIKVSVLAFHYNAGWSFDNSLPECDKVKSLADEHKPMQLELTTPYAV
jgi:hypothetical protein